MTAFDLFLPDPLFHFFPHSSRWESCCLAYQGYHGFGLQWVVVHEGLGILLQVVQCPHSELRGLPVHENPTGLTVWRTS